MMRIQSYRGLLAAVLLLVMAGGVGAQEFRATVRGQVVDSSQAALPGATITVRNQETGEMATATSNNQGEYTVPFLRPGLYSVTVEMSGFQKYTRTDMTLQVGQVAVINAQLGVGGITESVSVSAESPLLETQQGESRHRHRQPRASPSCRCSRAARWRSWSWSPASTTTRRRSISARSTTARSPPGR